MRKSTKIMIGIAATLGVLGVSASLLSTYWADKGATYTLRAESIEGKIQELDGVLQADTKLSSDMLLKEIELDIYKDTGDFLMTGQIYHTDEKSKIRWDYFGSRSSGMTYQEAVDPLYPLADTCGMTWEAFLALVEAAGLDEITAYGGDHVGVIYLDGTMKFTEEEKASTYDYDTLHISPNKDGSIRQLGYYLYEDGVCRPVEDMSGMNGEYECIYVSFSNKKESNSYRAVARLGILKEHKN